MEKHVEGAHAGAEEYTPGEGVGGEESCRDVTPGDVDVDAALGRLRRYGRWRMLTYCIICLGVNIPGTWYMLSIIFVGGEPDGYWCYKPPGGVRENATRNKLTGHHLWKHCHLAENGSSTNCPRGYTYTTDGGPTIVTDWDLVCDRDYLSEASQVVFSAGVMAGALLIPSIADRYGRRPVHLACQGVAIVFGVGLAFSNSITTFIVVRFILGAFREGLGLSGVVMACELFPADARPVAGISIQFFWSGAWMLLALLAYWIRNWRHLQLALSIISLVPAAAVWFVPESVVWLVARGRVAEAEEILQGARKLDGDAENGDQEALLLPPEKSECPLDAPGPQDKPSTSTACQDIQLASLAPGGAAAIDTDAAPQPPPTYTILSICRSLRLSVYTTCMAILWFINIVVYYGLSLSASLRGGDRYLYFFCSGVVEIPAYIFAMVFIKYYGRRRPLAFFHLVAAIGLFGMLGGKDLMRDEITEMAMAMLGKFGITASLAILVLYSNEIFPTTMRNAGFGLTVTVGRVGGVVAPIAVYAYKHTEQGPTIAFGVMAVIAMGVGMALPETGGRPLPTTIDDIESWEPGYVSTTRWVGHTAKGAFTCEDSEEEWEDEEKEEKEGGNENEGSEKEEKADNVAEDVAESEEAEEGKKDAKEHADPKSELELL